MGKLLEFHGRTRQETAVAAVRSAFPMECLGAAPSDELAFGMELFVGAATGRYRAPGGAGAEHGCVEQSDMLLARLSGQAGCGAQGGECEGGERHQSSLSEAFFALWRQYMGDARQISLCARVLGFYFLMVRTRGAAVQRWAVCSGRSEELVELHPAVIAALAAVPLTAEGYLPEEAFVALVAKLAKAWEEEECAGNLSRGS